jgi:carbamoyl-phosphate synthase large subunit
LNPKVLIPSGAGSPGFGGIFHCLTQDPETAVFCGDMNPRAYGKNLAQGFALMPPSQNEDYIQHVISAASQFGCNAILPITTAELPTLAQHQERLKEHGFPIAISSSKAIGIANNKAHVYALAAELGLPCVAYEVVNQKDAALSAIHRFLNSGFAVMKPTQGNGSRGLRIFMDTQELQQDYFNNKAGSVFSSFEAAQAEMPESFNQEMIISSYLPGTEYSADVICNRGQCHAIAIRSRDKTVSGISVRGTFLRHEHMESQIITFCKSLNLHGPVGFQFKEDHTGVPTILEINPRLQGAVSTALLAGINFPILALNIALGNIPSGIVYPKINISFNRYWKDIQE